MSMTGGPSFRGCVRPWLASLVVGLFLSACQSRSEVEHLEHVSPEHKPTSYNDAVSQLQRRVGEVFDGTWEASQQARQLTELGDIIRWLPEHAADSDLKKAEWEQVEQIAGRLSRWHATLDLTDPVLSEQRPQIERDIQQLISLEGSADRLQPVR